MPSDEVNDWRDLCRAAITEKDPEKLMAIIEKLNRALESHEQQIQRRPANALDHFQ